MKAKDLVKQLQEERAAKRQRTRYIALGALVASCAGMGGYATYLERQTRTSPLRTSRESTIGTEQQQEHWTEQRTNQRTEQHTLTDTSLDQLISQHAFIVRKEAGTPGTTRAQANGTLYLVGQTHWQPAATALGTKWTGNGDPDYIPAVQADIYHLICSLNDQAGLRFVVGEGIGPVELGVSEHFQEMWKQCDKDADVFFRKTTGQLGYTLAKDVLENKLVLYGVDDRKEMKELDQIEKQLFAIADKYLSARNRQLPSLATPGNTPEAYTPPLPPTPIPRTPAPQSADAIIAMNQEEMPLRKQMQALNDKRSLIYLQDALSMADAEHQQDVMIVIGLAHVPLMAEHYLKAMNTERRALYVLIPKSTPESERTRWANK